MKMQTACMSGLTVLFLSITLLMASPEAEDSFVEELVDATSKASSLSMSSIFPGDKTLGHKASSSPDCAMAYHMGAILDVAEKTCEAYKEASACAVVRDGKPGCSRWVETQTLLTALSRKGPEAVWKVCCYHAYEIGGYQTCSNPDPTCTKALNKHVIPRVVAGLAKSLVPLQKAHTEMTIDDIKRTRRVKQALSKKVVLKLNHILNRLQAARAEMWEHPNCHKFAKPTPNAKCGFGGVKYDGKYHSLSRTDLYCETIEWQYNQMGAGDSYMKKCPGSASSFRTPAQDAAWKKAQAAQIKSDLDIDVSTMPQAQIEAQFKAKMKATLAAQLKHYDGLEAN